MCSSKEQIKAIRDKYLATFSQDGVPPCSEIQGMQVTFDEYETNSLIQKQCRFEIIQ